MNQQKQDLLDLRDEVINAFRPIEQLFKIMDTSSVELYGELTRSCAEVGLELCQCFREKLEKAFAAFENGESYEKR